MNVTAIARKSAAIDPARSDLAAAIRAHVEAKAKVQNHKTAIDRALELIDQAEAKVSEATKGVEQAKEQHTAAVTRAANAGASVPPSRIAAARSSLENAQDEFESARRALAVLESDSFPGDAVANAAAEIDICILQLTVPVAKVALERARQLELELYETRGILTALQTHSDAVHRAPGFGYPQAWAGRWGSLLDDLRRFLVPNKILDPADGALAGRGRHLGECKIGFAF